MSVRHIVFIGGGPRTAMALDRLTANRNLLETGDLHVHVVDPYPVGAGRIWRSDQSPLLKLNSRAADVTMFTDQSVDCDGPAAPGPSLAQWLELLRAGQLDDVPMELLPGSGQTRLRREAASLAPEDFPTRRLQSCYLRWFFRRVARSFTATDILTVHEAEVLDINPDSVPEHRTVQLSNGEVIYASIVVLALGHLDQRLDGDPRAMRLASQSAASPALRYYPPGYTNDIDFSEIRGGEPVLVSGMGLAFTDLCVLLNEGRGGAFEPAAGGSLRYQRSGNEPVLWVGSRRGVPYHSKIRSELRVPAEPQLRYVTVQVLTALREQHGQLDFFQHVWPLVAKEVAYGYYRELFLGHPERTCGSFETFQQDFDRIQWYSRQRSSLVACAIPNPEDRLDFERFDAPLSTLAPNPDPRTLAENLNAKAFGAMDNAVREHILADLKLRDGTEHSQTQALFLGLLTVYMRFSHLLPLDWLTPHSRLTMSQWWQGFFSFVDSGPPAHRLRELLALHEAGLINFLGPDTEFVFDEAQQKFRATGRAGTKFANVLVDARLPAPTTETTTNQLLRTLLQRGLISAEPGGSGKMSITSLRQAIGRGGVKIPWLFAVGAGVAGWNGGAFSRPNSNAAPFRDTDELARQVLRSVAKQPAIRQEPSSWELAASVAEAHRTLG